MYTTQGNKKPPFKMYVWFFNSTPTRCLDDDDAKNFTLHTTYIHAKKSPTTNGTLQTHYLGTSSILRGKKTLGQQKKISEKSTKMPIGI